MGVDTGRALHTVIRQHFESGAHRLVYLNECRAFAELSELIERFNVRRCVIDSLPETHAMREFALRQPVQRIAEAGHPDEAR
jgi:hypothetical protein